MSEDFLEGFRQDRGVIVTLNVSRDQMLRWYKGRVQTAQARSITDGRTVYFPVNILQPFITHTGISGTFRIDFDSNGKFKSIKRYVSE